MTDIRAVLDGLIAGALHRDRAPRRFVLSPASLDALIEQERPLFTRTSVPGDRRPVFAWFPDAHPDLCPLVETLDKGPLRSVTAEAMDAMCALVAERGLSHYRRIPISLTDEMDALLVELVSEPWGDAPAT